MHLVNPKTGKTARAVVFMPRPYAPRCSFAVPAQGGRGPADARTRMSATWAWAA